jgi:hypothetical protein
MSDLPNDKHNVESLTDHSDRPKSSDEIVQGLTTPNEAFENWVKEYRTHLSMLIQEEGEMQKRGNKPNRQVQRPK